MNWGGLSKGTVVSALPYWNRRKQRIATLFQNQIELKNKISTYFSSFHAWKLTRSAPQASGQVAAAISREVT